jgi:hypothetical protein
MTTPFPFVAGAVLTAAELNAITTLPINDQTDDYTLVVGDVGKRVIMNKGTANTVTVDDSIFSVGDTIFIANKGAGVSTITAGAGVTINSASGLALVTSQSGQLIALSASSFLFVASDVTASAAGLELISTTTIGTTVSSVTVSSAFSADYDSYKIVVSGGAGSTSLNLLLRLGASTTAYYYGGKGRSYAGSDVNEAGANSSSWVVGNAQTGGLAANLDVVNPFLADETYFTSAYGTITTSGTSLFNAGFHNSAVSYADFTLLTSTGTITGGTIRVYGYKN